jgi:hypothetical protein
MKIVDIRTIPLSYRCEQPMTAQLAQARRGSIVTIPISWHARLTLRRSYK